MLAIFVAVEGILKLPPELVPQPYNSGVDTATALAFIAIDKPAAIDKTNSFHRGKAFLPHVFCAL
jgi:hypothetical protein